jgi:hypothetical protein
MYHLRGFREETRDHIPNEFDYYSALLLPFMKAVSRAIKAKWLKSSSG